VVKERIIFINSSLFLILGGNMAKVKVYGTPICPWCIKAKNFLKEHNIEFEDFDISSNEEAKKEMFDKSGQMGVPVLDIDGEIIVGFDVEKIKSLLKIKD